LSIFAGQWPAPGVYADSSAGNIGHPRCVWLSALSPVPCPKSEYKQGIAASWIMALAMIGQRSADATAHKQTYYRYERTNCRSICSMPHNCPSLAKDHIWRIADTG
jgi:hypothetical protein